MNHMRYSVREIMCVVALCAVTLGIMRALYVNSSKSMFEIHMHPTIITTECLGLIILTVALFLHSRGKSEVLGGLVTGAILFGCEVIATYIYFVRIRALPNAGIRVQMVYLGVWVCVFINMAVGAFVGATIGACVRICMSLAKLHIRDVDR
jgi:hypothetical protein